MGKIARLVMVTAENNNKFYNLTEESGMILIERGRIDVTSIKEKPVPMSKWDSLYKSKLKKGYVDQTHLFAEVISPVIGTDKKSSFADILDPAISRFINNLQAFANKQIEQNYTISSSVVTQKQIETAQTILNNLIGNVDIGADVNDLNRFMLELFRTLPRKMRNVQDWLLQPMNDKISFDYAMKLIDHEQNLLDTMKGQVKVYAATQEQNTDLKRKQTLLEAMGLEIFNIDNKEKELILSKIEDPNHKKLFKQGFRVNNLKTRKRFEDFISKRDNKKTDLFWHGSRNENWFSIIDSGLLLRPTNAILTGSMFGKGNYAASRFSKSLGYTSYSGSYWAKGNSSSAILSLFEFHTGNQYHINRHQSWHPSLNEKKLKDLGNYDSIFAHGGADLKNDEFVVYNESQSTIKYIIEIGK